MNIKQSLLLVLPAALAFAMACGDTTKTVAQGPGGTTPDAGTTPAGDDDDFAGPGDDDDVDSGGATNQCTAAAKTFLYPQTTVSKAEVKILGTESGVTKIYVDASAGGSMASSKNPRVYLKMDGTKAELSDVDAAKSTEWDIAFKRVDIFTNGGDAGPGKGAGLVVKKAFDAVTSADATGLAQEKFFTGDCEPQKDAAGFVLTTFSDWYDYDQETHIPTPFLDRTLVMKSADGTLYKIALLAYQGKNDGSTTGGATGQYVFQVKKL